MIDPASGLSYDPPQPRPFPVTAEAVAAIAGGATPGGRFLPPGVKEGGAGGFAQGDPVFYPGVAMLSAVQPSLLPAGTGKVAFP